MKYLIAGMLAVMPLASHAQEGDPTEVEIRAAIQPCWIVSPDAQKASIILAFTQAPGAAPSGIQLVGASSPSGIVGEDGKIADDVIQAYETARRAIVRCLDDDPLRISEAISPVITFAPAEPISN